MERLAEIRRRTRSLADLAEVVGAMRSLAAARAQQARGALPAIRRYADVIDGALAEAVALVPPGDAAEDAGRGAVVVFASEHGFVGTFNERLLERAAAERAAGRDALLVVGSRGAALASEQGLEVAWSTRMAAHGEGVVDVARAVADQVIERSAREDLRRVKMVYAKSARGAASEVTAAPLLPFDPAPYRRPGAGDALPPLTHLPPPALLDELVLEWLLAELMRAAMESFASENGARLTAMEAAHSGIEQKLEELSAEERRRRQDEITTELLDVVTGAQAVIEPPEDGTGQTPVAERRPAG